MAVQIRLNDDADGSSLFKKVVLPRKETQGTVTGFKIVPTKKQFTDTKGVVTNQEVKKIVMEVAVPEGTVSGWYNPKITKNRGNYRASELYKLLDTAKLLDTLKQFEAQIKDEETLIKFLEQYLKGKKLSFIPITIVPKNGGESYSGIQEVLSIE